MQKAIEIVKKISKQLDKNWIGELEECNLYKTFAEPIYRLEHNIVTLNTITCAIVYSYDPQSKWIDLKQDGFTINKNILIGLGADPEETVFKEFIELKNEDILHAIGNYLDLIPDWKYVTARKEIDYHAKYIRSTESTMTDVDEDKKIKARENIGRLIKEAVSQRRSADELIELIQRENVNTQHKVHQDFGVDYTQRTLEFMDDSKKKDILSWRDFIKYDVLPKKNKMISIE